MKIHRDIGQVVVQAVLAGRRADCAGDDRAFSTAFSPAYAGAVRTVEELAKDYHEEYELKRYLQSRWDVLVRNWDKLLAAPESSGPGAVSS